MPILKTIGQALALDCGPGHLGPRAGAGRTARRSLEAKRPPGGLDGFAEHIIAIADSLIELLDEAASRKLMVPPPISNSVHDLRGWAARVSQGTLIRPTAVDATRLLAYLRGLPDHQLLALLADLPWARLDALLDAVSAAPPLHARSPGS